MEHNRFSSAADLLVSFCKMVAMLCMLSFIEKLPSKSQHEHEGGGRSLGPQPHLSKPASNHIPHSTRWNSGSLVFSKTVDVDFKLWYFL